MNFSTRVLMGLTTLLVLAASTVMCAVGEAADWNAITLTWTAPGDDGSTGLASQYDIRYSVSSISGTDTTTWWSQATQCTGEPTPHTAGTTETFMITGLQASKTYYLMVKTADEVPNWSGFSNVAVRATTAAPDTIAPAAVRNLARLEQNFGRYEDFLLVLADACASVAPETQGRVSLAQEETEVLSGWPILLEEPARDYKTFGGVV
ncbi:MAG: hypothetical protein NTX17_01220 [Candidatus Eisenbacteria bacterium]|nr:hypothetical protein [Candidatus Eisenbacteria bacterium]